MSVRDGELSHVNAKMTDQKEDEKKEDDERLEFLYKYLTLSRKIKAEKWAKMLSNEEFKVP